MQVVLLLEYDGTGFYGSQVQPNRRTVAGVLAVAIQQLDAAAGRLHLAGRTDTGVHATGQVAAFEATRPWPPAEWQHRLNSVLPQDLVVRGATSATGLDVRRHATRRRYEYQAMVHAVRPALQWRWNGWWPNADPDRARAALALLPGEHDFAAFALETARATRRSLDVAELQVTGREWRFGFEARSFLTRQVRLMVGGVMSVATGSLDLEPFRRMIELGQRSAPLVAAPARGLLLTEVSYPDLRWPEQGGQL